MEFGDIDLICRGCNNHFLFTAGEQAYYQRMGLQNTPGRCPDCRARRKQRAAQEGRSNTVSSTSGQQQELNNHAVSPQPVSQSPAVVPPVEPPATLEASATTKAQSATDNAPTSPNTLRLAAPIATSASKCLLKKKWKARSRVLVFFTVQIYAVKDEDESGNVFVAVAANKSDNAAIAADKDVAANSSEVTSGSAGVIEPALTSVATTTPTTATTTVVTAIICSSCGKRTTVPFVPEPNRPVYCASCFFKQ